MKALPAATLRKAWLTGGVLLAAVIVYFSLVPAPQVSMDHGWDKLYHALAYLTLMLWFVQACARSRWSLLAVLCVGLGIALEFAQRYSGYRTFSYDDMLANAGGVAIAWMLAVAGLNEGLIRLQQRYARAL
jgi:VanZ family protein